MEVLTELRVMATLTGREVFSICYQLWPLQTAQIKES